MDQPVGRRRRVAAALLPAAVYVAWAASYYVRFGYPAPEVHDEFSYLLAADTFARGRLANPSPAFPEFFETFHVNVTPAYVSMYPPGQGLWLALGQVVMGHAWWGVVLSTALFVAAVGWAALAWMGPAWAMGAGFVALSYVLGTYWSTSYWGGSVAALGGAMALGAFGRLGRAWTGGAAEQRGPAAGLGAVWSAGCVMALLGRPYEGTVMAVCQALALGWLLLRSPLGKGQKWQELFRFSAGAVPVAAAGALFLMACNHASTGSPFRLAYIENARQYQIRRTFHWQSDRPAPVYRHEIFRATYEGLLRREMSVARRYTEMGTMFRDHYGSLKLNATGLAAAALWGGASGLGWVLGLAAAGLVAALMVVWVQPHYYAPFAASLAVAVAGGAAQAAGRKWLGRRRAWLVACIGIGLLAPRFALLLGRAPDRSRFGWQRAEIAGRLERDGGRHLVLVRYRPWHDWHKEWVYNGADLEHAPVLWARWHQSARLQEFLAHYADRKVWLLEPDLPGSPLVEWQSGAQAETPPGARPSEERQ